MKGTYEGIFLTQTELKDERFPMVKIESIDIVVHEKRVKSVRQLIPPGACTVNINFVYFSSLLFLVIG